MRSYLRETEGATAEQKPPIVTHLDIDSAESRQANHVVGTRRKFADRASLPDSQGRIVSLDALAAQAQQ